MQSSELFSPFFIWKGTITSGCFFTYCNISAFVTGYDAALYSAATSYYQQQQQAAKTTNTWQVKKAGQTGKAKPKIPPKQPQLHYCDVCKISCAGPQVSNILYDACILALYFINKLFICVVVMFSLIYPFPHVNFHQTLGFSLLDLQVIKEVLHSSTCINKYIEST